MAQSDHRPPAVSPVNEAAVLSALPLTVVTMDAAGVITWVSPRFAGLMDPRGSFAPEDRPVLVGRNVIELVHPDDQLFAAQLLEFGSGIAGRLMGPIQLRYLTFDGEARYTEAWSVNCLDDPDIGAYLLVVTEEAGRHRVGEAVSMVAEGAGFHQVMDLVVRAMTCLPMKGPALMVERTADSAFAILAEAAEPPSPGGRNGLGWEALFESSRSSREVVTHRLEDLDPSVGEAARAAGLNVLWSVAVPSLDRQIRLMCWHDGDGAPSPNQALHMRQAVDLLGLSLTQDRQRAELEYLAYHDALTGLPNRSHLYERMSDVTGDGISVLYLDLDGFKAVNDRHGHQVGDRLLVKVGEVLTSSVRDSDTVVRVGGDEFVVICPAPLDDDQLRALADRLIRRITDIDEVDGLPVRVGASAGLVPHGAGGTLDDLIREADTALYRAKSEGRGSWRMAEAGV